MTEWSIELRRNGALFDRAVGDAAIRKLCRRLLGRLQRGTVLGPPVRVATPPSLAKRMKQGRGFRFSDAEMKKIRNAIEEHRQRWPDGALFKLATEMGRTRASIAGVVEREKKLQLYGSKL